MVHNRCVAWTAVVIAASCFWSGSNVSWAAGKAEEGFVSLFDGKTLDGWHLMNGAQFVAQDGVLKLNGGRGWLRSDKEYSDFILRLEFRFMKPDQDGGVFLRSNMEGDDWPSRKYEVQCQNTARMGTIFGAAHDLNVELTQKTLKPVGEWNEYEITLVKSSVEVRLNGEVVSVSASMDKLTRGYLGLQGENGFHEYRNIRIKDLGRTEEGFVSLFDGKTLDGWHLMNGAQFVAQDGVLKLNGGRGWLRSDKEYSDFILRLEFRFMKPDQDGGVFLRSNMEGDDWPSRKYEVQCQNTARMGTIFGAAHDLNVELTQKTLKPVGEWNEYEITLVKSSVEVRLNGEVVSVSASMDKLTRGYLGLQGENGFHEYRNIRIKDLGK